MLRIVCDPNDYVSHRSVLGLRHGVGVRSCNSICEKVIANNLNYRDLFYNAVPGGVFTGRESTALSCARTTCAAISAWQPTDTLDARAADMDHVVRGYFDASGVGAWQAYRATV